MSYDKVGNKVKQVTAHCPKCLSMNYQPDYNSPHPNAIRCAKCGWNGLFGEMAFMKLRSMKSVPMRDSNPNYYMNKKTKYGGKNDPTSNRP